MGGIGYTEKHQRVGFPYKEKTCCVYIIYSKSNPDQSYIGGTSNLYARYLEHRHQLKRGIHHSKLLQKHADFFGLEDLQFEILMSASSKERLKGLEQFCIDLFSPTFNECRFAGSLLGLKRSEETKRKHSFSSLARKHSEETKQGMRERMLNYIKVNGHPSLGKNRIQNKGL